MAQKVNREELLRVLHDLAPGLATTEIIEQSHCFVFRKGRVFTFNDQVACQLKTDAIDLHGAVPASKLLAILEKLPDETLEVETNEKGVLFKGKRRETQLIMEQDVLLDIGAITRPGKWHPLPEEFVEAVGVVAACAGKDEGEFANTCVHFTSKYMEASDRFQIARYKIALQLTKEILVKAEVLRSIVQRGVSQYAVSDDWLHFKNANGLIMSVRLYVDEYPALGQYLKVDGEKARLPKGLVKAVENCTVFSSENGKDDNQVRVELRPNRLRVRGDGASGHYVETKKVDYKGPPIAFYIDPSLLIKLTEEYSECLVDNGAMRVDGVSFVYLTCLAPVEE